MAQRNSRAGKSRRNEDERSAGGELDQPRRNPASDLLMADIIIRAGSYMVRSIVERSLLKGKYDEETARRIVANQPTSQKLASIAIAKLASKSIPGAALIGTGLVARKLYARGKARRKARTAIDGGDNTPEA